MPNYDYLIVGGGMTADAAVRGIRSVDAEGTIGLVSREPDPPYDRPPLSKGLWTGQSEDRIWRETADQGVRLHLSTEVVRLDREERTAVGEGGSVYSYGHLLLATGGSPRTLDDAVPQVNYLRTYRDYRRLREDAREKKRFAVVGGGFIGSEIAASLASIGKDVVVLFPEEGLCRRILPEGLSRFLNGYYRERGVEVRAGHTVVSVRRSGDEFLLASEDGEERALRADAVVAGLGIDPETVLAENADLEVEDGIVVDETFRTEDPRIFAAGDGAAFWSPVLGSRLRIEHEDHANSSGMYAGRAMAGEPAPYEHLPFFYSDVFDLGYQAVGELDPETMETVEDWIDPHRRGIVYYVADDRLRGVLLWNLRGKLREARALVREGGRVMPGELPGRIRPD